MTRLHDARGGVTIRESQLLRKVTLICDRDGIVQFQNHILAWDLVPSRYRDFALEAVPGLKLKVGSCYTCCRLSTVLVESWDGILGP